MPPVPVAAEKNTNTVAGKNKAVSTISQYAPSCCSRENIFGFSGSKKIFNNTLVGQVDLTP